MRERRLETRQVALFGGRNEPPCQLIALLARAMEAGPSLLDVALRGTAGDAITLAVRESL